MPYNQYQTDEEKDVLRDKCGIIGVYNSSQAIRSSFLGLHTLQHRGQEAVGMVSQKKGVFRVKKFHGTVATSFSELDISFLSGDVEDLPFNAIGHVRYSTTGAKKDDKGIQPFFKEINGVTISVAHNGNLTNYGELFEKVKSAGIIPETDIDTELIMHLIFISKKESMKEKIIDAMLQLKGAFSLVILTDDFLCAARDAFGIRPLSMGKGVENEIVFASETCALDPINVTFVRDVQGGEVIFVQNGEIESVFPFPKAEKRFCIFEYVYFARPDSILEGRSVYKTRKEIGHILAKESPAEGDIVVPVPDSGVPSALGFSLESGIPFEFGIIRSHYIGRTFIDPNQKVRTSRVTMKHNPNRAILEGKRVILIDDSIVRGTTSKKIVELLFQFGAKEVHMRIASPPTKYPCFYGIDTPNEKDLIANNSSVEDIRKFIGATSLAYLSLEGLKTAVNKEKEDKTFCDACFTKNYFI